MGAKSTYHTSWDIVFEYLRDPGNSKKHHHLYKELEPLIKHWLLRLGIKSNLGGHAHSIFSDLYLKEYNRYQKGKLVLERCTASITTYYYPVIKSLCIDYIKLLGSDTISTEEAILQEVQSTPGVFEELWGEHKNTVLQEMNRGVKDWIELSSFEPTRKEYLRKRFIHGLKFLEILSEAEKAEFEAKRKWICRQGKKIASKIANNLLPAIIDCYRLPVNRKIDPKIIEKHLLGSKTKVKGLVL